MRRIIKIAAVIGISVSCTYEEIPPIRIPEPPKSEETEVLIAEYVTSPPNTLSNGYWQIADYKKADLSDTNIGETDQDDGILNVSELFDGLLNFNEGNDPDLRLKAAYDEDNIYILVSWFDTKVDASFHNWLYNGPADPRRPSEDTAGWTSQRQDDNMILSFEMGGAKKDIWNWSLALSEPMGFAIDQIEENGVTSFDEGDPMFVRNVDGTGNRAGPQYEWNGETQELTRPIGGFTILDPGYFLLNKEEFTGDILNGETLYQLECAECHGVTGDGEGSFGVRLPLNGPGGLNRLSREAFDLFAGDASHSGSGHWTILSQQEKDDVIARVRGFSGVPGYYLQSPTGSMSDIKAVGSPQINLARISNRSNHPGYQVLLIRPLNTGNADDVAFDPLVGEYSFSVYLTSGDELNRIGEENVILQFKSPDL